MKSHATRALATLVLLSAAAAPRASAVDGSSLALRSSGFDQGASWVLGDNGYVGTYIDLAAPADITISVQASGQAAAGVAPRMNIVVADYLAQFDVGPGNDVYQHAFSLPAGTHFVRAEFNNDPEQSARALTVASLEASGAAIRNTNSNVNALAAADSYIAGFRRGPASLQLGGVEPGADVHVKLRRHAFRFGTAVGGTTLGGVNNLLDDADYSSFLLDHFNTIVPSNAGKWAYNEGFRDFVSMQAADRFLDYAETNNLDVRMHNMLWADSQQPNWVNSLLDSANSGNASARDELRGEISERIDYYLGDDDGNPADDRVRRIAAVDLLNEHVHQPKYWNVYGTSGIADIFTEAASAVAAAGADAPLFLNEYNVLQYGADSYANWYREDVDALRAAAGAVGGVGVQYYALNAFGSNAHSAARIQQVLQNLSVTGLPVALTEFGVQTAAGTTVAQAETYLTETMRMVFGTPNASSFMMWGFWENDVWNQAPLAALVDADWNLTSVGLAYEQLMSQWDTDLNLPVAADGSIDFTGFYGDYEVTVDGKTYLLSHVKGTDEYTLVVDLPADFNGDSAVGLPDLTIWQTSYGAAGADADGDSLSTGGDFLAWQRQWGMTESMPVGSAATSAPEPAALVLLLCVAPLVAPSLAARHGFAPLDFVSRAAERICRSAGVWLAPNQIAEPITNAAVFDPPRNRGPASDVQAPVARRADEP